MNPRKNPYTPGAGSQPPELAGREDVIEKACIALDRTITGKQARGIVLYGLRGVGKTVLLRKLVSEAEERSFVTIYLEAPEDRSLPAALCPQLRAGLYKLKRGEEVKKQLLGAFRALKSFSEALKIKYGDIELSLDFDREEGIADSGNLESDLGDLLSAVAEGAREKNCGVLIAIDELQYINSKELEALIAAMHRIGQKNLPILLFAAGLPQLLGHMGQAKSYVERLLEFVPIGKLDRTAADSALIKPALEAEASYTREALTLIFQNTEGYPYYLQEWGKHSWNLAESSPITADDARRATEAALAELDASFFRVRFDRLKPSEKKYLRAMAELGPGPHRSGDVAEKYGKSITTVAPIRASLIAKGMVYSISHGETAFTVPLFDAYMKRVFPSFPTE